MTNDEKLEYDQLKAIICNLRNPMATTSIVEQERKELGWFINRYYSFHSKETLPE